MELLERVDRIESQLAIGQLPIRYGMACDARDSEAWVNCFIPDVQVGKDKFGRQALRDYVEPVWKSFYRSFHTVVGHRIDNIDGDDASGVVYSRSEFEIGDNWIVIAVCYFDSYQRVDGEWFFKRRQERHWYSADVGQRPQDTAFHHPNAPQGIKPPRFPHELETWASFWNRMGGADDVSRQP